VRAPFGRPGGGAARDSGAPAWASAAPGRALGIFRPGASYLALDFETTGLYPAMHRVIEIGAVRFRLDADWRAAVEGRLGCLVDPGVPVPDDARSVHGISDADLAGAPPFGEIAASLLAFSGGAVIVAHNASFDLSFLDAELAQLGLERPAAEAADTVALARRAFPGRRSYRLGAIAAELGIETGAAHRALDDAATCMALFAKCAERLA
jgi:DNA polymerase III subunit epsilon